jgi:hypothetical protein
MFLINLPAYRLSIETNFQKQFRRSTFPKNQLQEYLISNVTILGISAKCTASFLIILKNFKKFSSITKIRISTFLYIKFSSIEANLQYCRQYSTLYLKLYRFSDLLERLHLFFYILHRLTGCIRVLKRLTLVYPYYILDARSIVFCLNKRNARGTGRTGGTRRLKSGFSNRTAGKQRSAKGTLMLDTVLFTVILFTVRHYRKISNRFLVKSQNGIALTKTV